MPADPGSSEWQASDEELGKRLCDWLGQAGLPVRSKVLRVTTRKLRQAYPIYRQGYDSEFARIDHWLSTIDGLVSFVRQGLFVHDNTHHALYMAYSAAKCLRTDGSFDRDLWSEHRQVFETHVVED